MNWPLNVTPTHRWTPGEDGHYCDVGGVPQSHATYIRRCSCGQYFSYGHGPTGMGLLLWRPMGRLALWRHRRKLQEMADEFWALDG